MSNEDLVLMIQQGRGDLLPELWGQVERLATKIANRWAKALGQRAGVTFEDLYDSGYIAMFDAVTGYDPTMGAKFATYFCYCLKGNFAAACGYSTTRAQNDPMHTAASLDAPLATDDEDYSLLDTVANCKDVEADVTGRIFQEERRKAVEAAVATLPEDQQVYIRRRFWSEDTKEAAAIAAGAEPAEAASVAVSLNAKALRNLRHGKTRRTLEAYVDSGTDYYRHVGVEQFQRTGLSAVEEIVLQRERLRSRADTMYS